jgi:outer membrane protein assembly factor BamD
MQAVGPISKFKYISSIGVLLFVALLVSCSGYNKIVKGDDYPLKFSTANDLYEKKQFLRSITLYEQIYQKMPKTGEGELSYYRIGKAYFEEKDFYMSGYYFGAYTQRYPFSSKAQEALFLSALCSVYNSPSSSLDQNDTELAINNLQQFVNTYPQSELVDSCNRIMDGLRFKIELKNYDAVKLYERTQNYRAAVTTSMTFLEDYPRSKFKEEISFILVKNSYYLAINSIDSKKKERIEQTIERYRNFTTEFPESSMKKEANQISDEMYKELQKIESTK